MSRTIICTQNTHTKRMKEKKEKLYYENQIKHLRCKSNTFIIESIRKCAEYEWMSDERYSLTSAHIIFPQFIHLSCSLAFFFNLSFVFFLLALLRFHLPLFLLHFIVRSLNSDILCSSDVQLLYIFQRFSPFTRIESNEFAMRLSSYVTQNPNVQKKNLLQYSYTFRFVLFRLFNKYFVWMLRLQTAALMALLSIKQ